ncbi:hypothetical protein ACTNDY_06705 [Tissierellaceae bacterium HCP3S3_D8]
MTKSKEAKATENKFTKSQVLASKKLNYSKDLINAILEDGKIYTLKEVEETVNKYLEGEVGPNEDKGKVK